MKPKFTTKHVGRAAYVRRARKLMSKLKPLDRWQQEMTPEQRARAIRSFGSVEAAYESMESGLQRLVDDPAPTAIRVTKNGVVYVYR